ncbi:unnamed protein product [Caenorhabditis sp. 36 PRJEB53466]|nr:unnamed protein product [Caenorhabditis sp. 36 PRJEB53466]
MYADGFGNLYHPKLAGFSCRDIPRDLEYNNRKLVHHNHQGRRIKKKRERLVLFRGVQIDGRQIKKPVGPTWAGQVESLERKLKIGGMEVTLKEVAEAWKDWTREAAWAYLNGKETRVTHVVKAPWSANIAQNIEKISDQLRLNTKIITMFFKSYRQRCLIDLSFLLSEKGRTVPELEKQLHNFVKDTKKILSFEWPMAVANLMLDEGNSWIPLFVTATSHTVFNAVAATMARLLYDVVMENITRVKTFFDVDDRAKLIIILQEGEEEFDYWQRINILLDLCKIPRVDHKIYPRMFAEAYIDVTNWFDSQSIVFKPLPQPFEVVNGSVVRVQQMLDSFEKTPDDMEFCVRIAEEILRLRDQVLQQKTRVLKDFIIYDSSEIKKRTLDKILELEKRVKGIVLNHLSAKNNAIRAVFTSCSAKLYRNDVLTQLRNIEDVQNELPSIKQKIAVVGKAYKTYMDYFTMPDYDIRQYYEISRLGFKLEQLANFVWDRISHDRQWITKQVSEQTSKNYYECEMIEKEWLDCLKKYRSAVRINEVQKVQIKMLNLEERSTVLKEKDEQLIGQRSLLGLPSSPIDCVRIAKLCQFFSRLSTLHFKTLLHHESCLRMRISDVDHNSLVSETERLLSEKENVTEMALSVNEHSTTSKEALNKIQHVLAEFEKLLPVLGAISCQAMKDRHWQQILQDTEHSLKVEGNPLVSELLEMNFIEKAEQFEQVGAQAEKERILEISIDKMREQWKSAKFVTHHGGELLTTELNVQMQAHLARSQTILSSPHAFSILDHIRHWLDTLLSLNTFVHLYKQCDARWRKIEGVFSTEDIAYQMPLEFRTFKKISLRWVHISNQITEERPILEQMDLVQQLNMDLSELEVLFGRMENGFHAYLRKKRAVFPRLFALSDELLLSLICDSREPANCKSYIPLLFPALTTFDQNTKMEIVSVSTKTETIPLAKPVNVNVSKRHVEKWMHELDAQIKATLRTRTRQLIEKMNYKLSPVESVLGEPVQVAFVYLKIAFCWQLENSLRQSSMTVLASELKICLRECQHIVIHKKDRAEFLPPLYHIYKAANHLVNKFINEQVVFIDDHRWTSQLRYYWHMENIFIRVGTVSTRYDYEIQDLEHMLDYKLIDEAVKYFVFMNHFGLNFHGTIDAQLARQVAGALGRPFAFCDSEKELESKMLIEGALLFGGIVYMQGSEIGKQTERDMYSLQNLSSLKYHFESEITINMSCMFFLTSSAFSTARALQLDPTTYSRAVDDAFSLNSVTHREKKVEKFQIICELEKYTGNSNISKNYTKALVAKVIENEAIEADEPIEQTFFTQLNVCMSNKNKRLLEKLLQIAPLKSRKSLTLSRTPKSSDAPRAHDDDPPFIRQKTEELCALLQDHQVVAVCGASGTGKSRIIARAARLKSADMQVEFGLWEDMQVYGETLKSMRRPNKWIIIDGHMDQKTLEWFERIANPNTMFPWRELPIIAPSERVIVETDCLDHQTYKRLPMVYLETSGDFAQETTLDAVERAQLTETMKYFTEFAGRQLEVMRKIEGLKKSVTTQSDKVFNHLLATSLLTVMPVQQLMSGIFKSQEAKLAEFYRSVPYSKGWYTYKEQMSITPEQFYMIYSINLILNSNFIPLLICQPSHEFEEFVARLQTELDALGWHPITMSIDKMVTIEEINAFVGNCAIMFGGHEVSDGDGANFFLIKGIENASVEVLDWLRNKFERTLIMKMIFIVSNTTSIETFPSRIQKFLFQLNWTDIINVPDSLTLFPLAKYHQILKSLTRDTKQKEVGDSIRNQLIDGLLDAKLLTFYEKVSELSTTASEYRLVRGNAFVEPTELCAIYQNAIQEMEDREKRIRIDRIVVSPSDSRIFNLIEKVTQVNYGHIVVVGGDKKLRNALTISTELNKQALVTNQGIKRVEQWRELMNGVLRNCLIDGRDTVLGLEIGPAEDELVGAILVDVTCICCHKMIPLRYLSRLLLSEFGEKHTIEGKGIWETLEARLAPLKIVLALRSSDFSWLMNCHRMLLSVLVLVWWGESSSKEQEREMLDELHSSQLFSKLQTDQIIKVMGEMVNMKMISTRKEKMDILSTIMKLAIRRREEVKGTMTKYEKGMEKMKRAEEQVAGMQAELLRLQPQLVRTSIETSMLMSTIEKETIDVENAREVVAANENKANEAATKAQALKAESEAELASAIPALESAVEALETMTQSDVSSLKTMRFPPYAVRLCMEAVCILLGVKPAKVINEIGEVVSDYWVSGQKLLSDIHFLAKIRGFARDTMSRKTMKLIRDKYLSKEEFDPENVKQCSLAAEGLCRWVLAIDMYNQISKIVEPKRERLRKAEILVKQHLKQLEVKRKALLKVTEKLQGLSDQFSQMCQKKQELESQISSCEVRMERAERLVQALGGERDKWKSKITDITHEDSLNVPYSVGFTLALHLFGKLPIDEREKELQKTMRILFPKLEITIPCDLKSLALLVDNPICFVNDDHCSSDFLHAQFAKVVLANEWTESERAQCLAPNSVLLFEYSEENKQVAKEVEEAEYYKQGEHEIVLQIAKTVHEVNKNFRVFFRTRRSSTILKHSITINNRFSDRELRHEVCEKMGSANWFETLSHYNELVESRDSYVRMMEKTENEMLDLLGRSKDLDDERAIDLLAEARNLQSTVTAKNKELAEVEHSLRTIENKMSEAIDYSLKVIKMCYSLQQLDPFYAVSLESLVDVLGTKLTENVSNINMKEVSYTISNLYWNSLNSLLSWEDKLIVHHLLFRNLSPNVDAKIEVPRKNPVSFDSFSNFSSFVTKSEAKQLILLKYDAEAYATLLQFGQVTRNANWKVYSILEHVLTRLEKLADEPIWLMLNINQSDQVTLNKLKAIVEKWKQLPVVHSSFRIVCAYSEEVQCSDEIISLSFRRFYFSASSSLAQQIRRILCNLSIRTSLDKSEESQRIQIIRLMALHYGMKLRRKFDKEFQVPVDDADLLAMMKLYQELRNLSDQPNEVQDSMKVRTNVIEPIYYGKTNCLVKRNIIGAMVQWIVEGNLSIPADTLLRSVIRDDQNNFEDFSNFIQSHDDSILCGFNARISREYREHFEQRMIRRMKSLVGAKEGEHVVSKTDPGRIKPRSCLLEVEKGQMEVDGRELSNLAELVSFLKLKFCAKYKMSVSDVTVVGEFVDADRPIHKKDFEDNPMLKITHCTLVSAHLVHGEIREPHSRQGQYTTVLLRTLRKTGTLNSRSLSFVCPETLQTVVRIPFQSQFPIAHWHLRGAFVTTARTV